MPQTIMSGLFHKKAKILWQDFLLIKRSYTNVRLQDVTIFLQMEILHSHHVGRKHGQQL